jgi:hypothetical protein
MRDGQVTEDSWKKLCPMKISPTSIEIIPTVDVECGEDGTTERLFVIDFPGTPFVESGRSSSVILEAFQLQSV